MLGKISGAQRAMARVIIRRFVITIVADTALGPFPFWTLFVLMAHYRETKVVKTIWMVLGKLEKARHGNIRAVTKSPTSMTRTTIATT